MLNSDVIRKRLAGLLPTDRAVTAYGSGIYDEAFTKRTYAALHAGAEEELHAGRGVIIDATYKQREDRHALLELGHRLNVPVLFLECRARPSEIERRLRERARRRDSVSDATVEIARQEQTTFPPFDDLLEVYHWQIDTERDLDETLAAVEATLTKGSKR